MSELSSIRIVRSCLATGGVLVAGKVYAIPSEVSENDAGILVRMGKAERVAGAPAPRSGKSGKTRGD